MSLFIGLKLVHLLAVVMMIGATIINGLLHGLAVKATPSEASTLTHAVGVVNRRVMLPSFVVLPLSGAALTVWIGYAWTEFWIVLGLGLTAALVLAFAVGARLEARLNTAAQTAERQLPPAYFKTFKRAAPIGAGALILSLITLWVMIAKPV
ncbi:DUF2269 family protein [uncultured Pelagimonas sp.]|uniref:DUF2269 family protein n=1 Tax=uncultured Pelagimonas sp. TaxID=1618102 RepID=UPI00261F6E17|nr:DUF2269 family protein [uncultured Pelagimonas sp.]